MSTFRDAARSQYEQENYDPEFDTPVKCDECGKKLKKCSCPEQTPELVPTKCQDCGTTYNEEYFGNYDETPHRCGSCWMKHRGEDKYIGKDGEILF